MPLYEINKLFKVKMLLNTSLLQPFQSMYIFNKQVEEILDGLGWQS